jgi:hypothetical protein
MDRIVIPVKIDISCRKGEAVFYQEMPEIMGGLEGFNDAVVEIRKYIEQIANLKDDRLYALVADLLTENAVDAYLSELMPRYQKELADKKEFTFSLKIAVARGLKLCPAKFFNGADVLRRIRNEFAHELEKKAFEDLKPKLIREMDKVLRTYYPKKSPTFNSIREKFSSLMINTIIEIRFQSRYVRSLNSYLRDDMFYDDLLVFCRSKNKRYQTGMPRRLTWRDNP